MSDLIGQLTLVSLGASVLGLLVAVFFYFRVKGLPEGTDTMNMIARYIREGSMAFLMREYKVLAWFVLVVAGLLVASNMGEGQSPIIAVSFAWPSGLHAQNPLPISVHTAHRHSYIVL